MRRLIEMLTKTMAESMENIPDEKKVNKNADKEIDKGVEKNCQLTK